MPDVRKAATPEEAAYVFLERAKDELSNTKNLIPQAILVNGTGEGQTYDLWGLVFTEETKKAAFERVVSEAKEKSATAIITIADAVYGHVDDGPPWKDCIFVTVSGPGIETVTLHVPYSKSRWLKKI